MTKLVSSRKADFLVVFISKNDLGGVSFFYMGRIYVGPTSRLASYWGGCPISCLVDIDEVKEKCWPNHKRNIII